MHSLCIFVSCDLFVMLHVLDIGLHLLKLGDHACVFCLIVLKERLKSLTALFHQVRVVLMKTKLIRHVVVE